MSASGRGPGTHRRAFESSLPSACWRNDIQRFRSAASFASVSRSMSVVPRSERVQRAVDPDDAFDQPLALFTRDVGVVEALFSLEALAPEVLLRLLDAVTFARRHRLA